MKLLEMKRQRESIPEFDIRAALVEFEAQLVALSRRRRFTVCGPKNAHRPPRTSETITVESAREKIEAP